MSIAEQQALLAARDICEASRLPLVPGRQNLLISSTSLPPQVEGVLLTFLTCNPHPTLKEICQLASKTGSTPVVIYDWFIEHGH